MWSCSGLLAYKLKRFKATRFFTTPRHSVNTLCTSNPTVNKSAIPIPNFPTSPPQNFKWWLRQRSSSLQGINGTALLCMWCYSLKRKNHRLTLRKHSDEYEVLFVVFTVLRSAGETATPSDYDLPPARAPAQWRYWSMWTTWRRRQRRRSAWKSTTHEPTRTAACKWWMMWPLNMF